MGGDQRRGQSGQRQRLFGARGPGGRWWGAPRRPGVFWDGSRSSRTSRESSRPRGGGTATIPGRRIREGMADGGDERCIRGGLLGGNYMIRHRVTALLSVLTLILVGAEVSTAQGLPPGFNEQVVFDGLDLPTVVQFAADGRVFVGEKSGLIKVFPSLTVPTPTIFADLRSQVHNYWDRGLLGMALHPNFPTTPYVYVLYTFNAEIGGIAPRWPTVDGVSDGCPTPPGPNTDGCVVSGRRSRLSASGSVMTGPETVLLEGWCQQ